MRKFLVNRYVATVLVFGLLGFFITKRGMGVSSTKDSDNRVGTVKRQDVVRRVTVAGNLYPNKKTVISAPYNGYIKKIFVKVGQKVKMNDPVVSIVQSLHSAADDSYPIRAPFNGEVTQVLKTEGEYIEQGKDLNSSIVRIDDPSRLFITADVPESDIDRVKIGQEAQIKITANPARTYKGIITEISQAAKDKGSSRAGDHVDFTIKIEVLERDDLIKPGMSTLVDIVTNKGTNVLALRQEFVDKKNDKYFVILENGVRRDIEVGLQNEDTFEILKGLKEGEKVKIVDFASGEDENHN